MIRSLLCPLLHSFALLSVTWPASLIESVPLAPAKTGGRGADDGRAACFAGSLRSSKANASQGAQPYSDPMFGNPGLSTVAAFNECRSQSELA